MRVCLAPADTCEADCMRKRAEQSLQAAIKTLRKSISRQQFSVQVAGTEYEVAQRPAKAPEGQGACSTGQVLQDGKCGESRPPVTQMLTLSFLPHAAGANSTRGRGPRNTRSAREKHRSPHHNGCHVQRTCPLPGPGQGPHLVEVCTCNLHHSPGEKRVGQRAQASEATVEGYEGHGDLSVCIEASQRGGVGA